MIKNIRYTFLFYAFWVGFFMVERLTFLLYNLPNYSGSYEQLPKTFLYGLRMDASMAAYICVLPLLAFLIKSFIPAFSIPVLVSKVYGYTLIFLCSLLTVLNLNIYREWGTKLPYRVISTFFSNPYEAIISSQSAPIALSIALIVLLFAIGAWCLYRLLKRAQPPGIRTAGAKVGFTLLCVFVLFFLIRSGFQTTPLNPSMAYFSSIPILNHTAVNTEWNLLDDYLHSNGDQGNPYRYMSTDEATALIQPYIRQPFQETTAILNTRRPNVVLLILESFTAELIESLGGEQGITPHMETWIDQGVLFKNIYAAGDRTDKGIIAIMSAFPSQATKSIIKNVNKLEHLPSIGQTFAKQGYQTSFFYGGESEFYNIKSYMLSHGIQQVIDRSHFPTAQTRSKWGAFDHLTLQKQIDFLNQTSQPFFSVLLTLSNHEPFEVPGKHKFGDDSNANLFRSTAYYTDSALYDYLSKAKNTSWYQNTLFVIMADHGHRLPSGKKESFEPSRYHIPFLLFGEPIKESYRGQTIDKIGNQTDLAATLFGQLGMNSTPFYWSRDLLDAQTKSFAFFNWDNGLGVVLPNQCISFDNVGKRPIYIKNTDVPPRENQRIIKIGQAYLQSVYQQYLDF